MRLFDCDRECRDGHGELLDEQRARRGCTRLDLEAVHWLIEPRLLLRYLGRAPNPGLEGERVSGYPVDWKRPWEDVTDGCPRGWIDNPFTLALRPFIPRRTSTGARDTNYRLERCDDWLILDAVDTFIHEQERCLAEIDEQRHDLATQRDR
ncbi:hypothetical protein PPSIR1_10940 [Plesiocystis pacifica SIR-1]|uniref:Uncharacterized protein n=1 Tax=Plesiocystis pacifica SIR-1 TaxID=391625 RepID=A6G522_9BACT|nr:hypothetical protein [Plesiocystis pacifica]EDM79114.1 hypothetical protein PPSIR1_10940 [Plesiocystis pacifica SIR-1]